MYLLRSLKESLPLFFLENGTPLQGSHLVLMRILPESVQIVTIKPVWCTGIRNENYMPLKFKNGQNSSLKSCPSHTPTGTD